MACVYVYVLDLDLAHVIQSSRDDRKVNPMTLTGILF